MNVLWRTRPLLSQPAVHIRSACRRGMASATDEPPQSYDLPKSEGERTTHEQRTGGQPRLGDMYTCALVKATPLTKDVLGLRFRSLRVDRATPKQLIAQAYPDAASTVNTPPPQPAGIGRAGIDTTETDGRPRFKFRAGQWVDLWVPPPPVAAGSSGDGGGGEVEGLPAGGFTMTSSPKIGYEEGEFELAVQKAPRNPVADWLWREASRYVQDVVTEGTADPAKLFRARPGGQFHFPPVNFRRLGGSVSGVGLVAGGVGINPMRSILHALDALEPVATQQDGHVATTQVASSQGLFPQGVHLLYGTKDVHEALYLDELRQLFARRQQHGWKLTVFESRKGSDNVVENVVRGRRIDDDDLRKLINGDTAEAGKLYYVCGPAQMTDFVQESLLKLDVPRDRVQTERWW
ncbi:hypothetical protein PYCC9005_003829 [Savitreella phatthalungensis]